MLDLLAWILNLIVVAAMRIEFANELFPQTNYQLKIAIATGFRKCTLTVALATAFNNANKVTLTLEN
jgi:hypothetical protein